MRLNLKPMLIVLAAVALVGTGSIFASPPAPSPGALETDGSAYQSGRASMLLAEIKAQTAQLRPNTDTLGTFARNPE